MVKAAPPPPTVRRVLGALALAGALGAIVLAWQAMAARAEAAPEAAAATSSTTAAWRWTLGRLRGQAVPLFWAMAVVFGGFGLMGVLGRGAGGVPSPDLPDVEPPSPPRRPTDGALPVVVTKPPATAVVPAAPESVEGKVFGRYQLVKRIAAGGMSEIYTAVASGAEGFTRTFVIKRLKPELAREQEVVNQFIDEARVQAALVHENIVPVFDLGTAGSEYFMAEEYIVGRDVRRLCERCQEVTGGPLAPRLVYYIAHQTLQALQYAHTKRDREGRPLDIVHRDVSALNIMVTATGQVKLFDFGIAKTNGRVSRTQNGVVKGNANYMSPEQARGQPVDGRSDLFSLALVMFYGLTGRLLYDGPNDLDVLFKAACGPTEADLELVSRLPDPAPLILGKALAIDPARRFQTAAEFAQAIAARAGTKAEAATLMAKLFGDDLKTEAG